MRLVNQFLLTFNTLFHFFSPHGVCLLCCVVHSHQCQTFASAGLQIYSDRKDEIIVLIASVVVLMFVVTFLSSDDITMRHMEVQRALTNLWLRVSGDSHGLQGGGDGKGKR